MSTEVVTLGDPTLPWQADASLINHRGALWAPSVFQTTSLLGKRWAPSSIECASSRWCLAGVDAPKEFLNLEALCLTSLSGRDPEWGIGHRKRASVFRAGTQGTADLLSAEGMNVSSLLLLQEVEERKLNQKCERCSLHSPSWWQNGPPGTMEFNGQGLRLRNQ